jgi:putative DNA primase/helicase
MAKEIARALHAQSASVSDEDFKREIRKFARSSESAARIKATLECAKSERSIPVEPKDLDQDPWLLNCANGTLNLKLGSFDFRPATPEDLITKMAGAEFDSDATCPLFLAFLDRICDGNRLMIRYIKRVFGYAITGSVAEKAIFLMFGHGNNGKTTLLEVFRHVIGDYSGQIMIQSLLADNRFYQTTAMADLADLGGARFVTTSEADQGSSLAEAQIKQLTGMGQLKGCRKYENPFSYTPTFKIFMDSNYKPEILGTDPAIWDRLKVIPFTAEIPKAERDRHLLEKLKGESSGILRWAVEGCLEWQEAGLMEPPEVTKLVAEWRGDSDRFAPFIDSECIVGPNVKCESSRLLDAFRKYVQSEGIDASDIEFREYIQERLGCKPHRTSQAREWMGISLRSDTE